MKTAKEILCEVFEAYGDDLQLNITLNPSVSLIEQAMEAYHEEKTRCSEFEIDFNGNVFTRLKFIDGKLSVIGAMNGYGDGIEIDKIKITELAEPIPPKINAE